MHTRSTVVSFVLYVSSCAMVLPCVCDGVMGLGCQNSTADEKRKQRVFLLGVIVLSSVYGCICMLSRYFVLCVALPDCLTVPVSAEQTRADLTKNDPGRDRTSDPLLRRQMLYPLSYRTHIRCSHSIVYKNGKCLNHPGRELQ
jgi:hypothetical protein